MNNMLEPSRLRAVNDESNQPAIHGYTGYEIPPRLAHDAAATVAEAKRLWAAIARPDIMIRIPATPAGIEALEELVHAGINTDMTLIFSPFQVQAVRAAHRRGLARRLQDKLSVQRIASVASVFTGRVDAAVDALLAHTADVTAIAVRGRAGIAAARLIHRDWKHDNDTAFAVFAAFGAAPQSLLWVGDAAATPGEAAPEIGLDAARAVLAQLAHHGIDLETVGRQLLAAGLLHFEQAFDELLAPAA